MEELKIIQEKIRLENKKINEIDSRIDIIKKLYPQVKIIYAFNSPKQYGLDDESVNIQMNFLSSLIKDIPVTKFYSSELYGKKVAEYLHIENRVVDIEKKFIPICAKKIRENYEDNRCYLEEFVIEDISRY